MKKISVLILILIFSFDVNAWKIHKSVKSETIGISELNITNLQIKMAIFESLRQFGWQVTSQTKNEVNAIIRDGKVQLSIIATADKVIFRASTQARSKNNLRLNKRSWIKNLSSEFKAKITYYHNVNVAILLDKKDAQP